VLSPLKKTLSHPIANPLGWLNFFQLTEQTNCPTFALGGMKREDMVKAWAHGAQGIAAIRAWW
jgi:8-oxo-dGTP diphosphatase